MEILISKSLGKVSSEGITRNENDPVVNCLAVSQTQKYFAVGTSTGFEIIQNDSSISPKKLKKNVILNESVVMIEMMYKSNFIALVFEKDRNKVISK